LIVDGSDAAEHVPSNIPVAADIPDSEPSMAPAFPILSKDETREPGPFQEEQIFHAKYRTGSRSKASQTG
jgi:hypothetical protein